MSIRMNLVKAKRNQNNTSGILFNNQGFFLEERLREVCNASMTDYCSLRTKKKLEEIYPRAKTLVAELECKITNRSIQTTQDCLRVLPLKSQLKTVSCFKRLQREKQTIKGSTITKSKVEEDWLERRKAQFWLAEGECKWMQANGHRVLLGVKQKREVGHQKARTNSRSFSFNIEKMKPDRYSIRNRKHRTLFSKFVHQPTMDVLYSEMDVLRGWEDEKES